MSEVEAVPCQGSQVYVFISGHWTLWAGPGCVGTCTPPLVCRTPSPLEILKDSELRKIYASLIDLLEKPTEGIQVSITCSCLSPRG